MRLCVSVGLLILLFNRMTFPMGMEPDSLFKLATNRYIETYKKNYQGFLDELNSDKFPLEIVLKMIYEMENGRDNFILIDILLNQQKFEPLYSRMLDRIVSMRNLCSNPINYFHYLLLQNPFRKELVNLIIEKYGIKFLEVADQLVVMKDSQSLEKLIKEFKFNFNARLDTDTRSTLLHRAILLESDTSVEILLKNGALPNLKNKNGETPLDIALQNKRNKEIISLLQQHGAETNKYVSLIQNEQIEDSKEENKRIKARKESSCGIQ